MSTQELCDKICADRHVIEIWSECAVQMNSKKSRSIVEGHGKKLVDTTNSCKVRYGDGSTKETKEKYW
jgi:hypothetical protein